MFGIVWEVNFIPQRDSARRQLVISAAPSPQADFGQALWFVAELCAIQGMNTLKFVSLNLKRVTDNLQGLFVLGVFDNRGGNLGMTGDFL